MGSVIQGALHLGNIDTDRKPGGWQGLAWEAESQGTPLALLTSIMQTEEVSNTTVNWFEQDLELSEVLSDAAPVGATSMTFKDKAGAGVNFNLRAGSLLKNTRTDDIVMVSQTPTSNTGAISVTPRMGTLSKSEETNSGDRWIMLSPADQDTLPAPKSRSIQPDTKTNYIQLHRHAFSTGLMTTQERLRGGPEHKRAQRAAKNAYLRLWERTWVHGEPKQTGGSGDLIRGITGGLLYPITINVKDFGGVVSETAFDRELVKISRYGSRSKLFLGGHIAISTVTTFAKIGNAAIFSQRDADTYGLDITTYQHANLVRLQMLYIPTLGISTDYGNLGIVIDPLQLKRLVFKGFEYQLVKGIQARGDLVITDEYRMAAALKLCLEKHHGVLKGMTKAQA